MNLLNINVVKIATTLITLGALTGTSKAATIITSADFTGTGVMWVDSSSSTHNFQVTAPNEVIVGVEFFANLSSSGGSINSDGTIGGSTDNPFNNELGLVLTSPTGTSFQLIATGTYISGGVGSELIGITFQEGAAAQGGNLGPGIFAPTGGSFNVFNNEAVGGMWSITVSDSVTNDPKSLNAFTLTLTTTTIPEPSTTLLVCIGGLAGLTRRTRAK